jgi:hypothetical protein
MGERAFRLWTLQVQWISLGTGTHASPCLSEISIGNSADNWPVYLHSKQHMNNTSITDEAVPQLRRLVAGFPPRRPRFEPRSGHVRCVVEKWHWGRFSPTTSGSPANYNSTDCSKLIVYHPGWYNRPVSGRRTKWTQSNSTPRNW